MRMRTVLLLAGGAALLAVLARRSSASPIVQGVKTDPYISQQNDPTYKTSDQIIAQILVNDSTASAALKDIQNWYNTPLDPSLDGVLNNQATPANPIDTPLNNALRKVGLDITWMASNPGVQAQSWIKDQNKFITQIQREISSPYGQSHPDAVRDDQVQIASIKNSISKVNVILGGALG